MVYTKRGFIMSYKRVLTVQDISCFGQCSLTVALPILSVAGSETAIIPSAVLSTHTGGFKGYTFRDLTDDIPLIQNHWLKEGISFDAVYSGYLGSVKQVGIVKELFAKLSNSSTVCVVDPAMADNGKLYPAFDKEFVEEMKKLCFSSDIILPNITEACFLTDNEYKENYDEAYIDDLISKLLAKNAKTIILTGVGFSNDTTGVMVVENGKKNYYCHRRIPKNSHGTGDIYASAFVGSLMKGKTVFESAKIAANFTISCIEKTLDDPSHWYGVKFELALPELVEMLK